MSSLTQEHRVEFKKPTSYEQALSAVREFIAQGLYHEQCLLTERDVINGLLDNAMHLRSIVVEGRCLGAYLFEIVRGGRGSALNILSLGGKDMHLWLDAVLAEIELEARNRQCLFVCETGRAGWRKVLGNKGWVEGPVTMMKVL